MPSRRINPDPERTRNWINATISSTPSTKKIAATTKCERLQCESRMECKIATASDVDNPYQHSPEKCSSAPGSEGINQVCDTSEDDDPTD